MPDRVGRLWISARSVRACEKPLWRRPIAASASILGLSGSLWNFGGDPRVDGSDGNGLGELRAVVGLGGGGEGVTFDRDDELGVSR